MRHALLVLALAGCSGEANHLGNPLLWPVYGLGNAVGNAVYDERRARVTAHIAAHQAQLRAGDPAAIAALAEIARVAPPHHGRLRAEITALPEGPGWVERATVIAMVLGHQSVSL